MHSEYNRAMTRLGADLGNGEERAVSSLPVAGAKVALSVHTWLTKPKEGPRITSFSWLFLSFFTGNAIQLLWVSQVYRW